MYFTLLDCFVAILLYHQRSSIKHACNNSNKCETAFNETKRVMADQRKSMDSSTSGMVMMLDFNDDLWDTRDVHDFALAAKRPGELQDED